jgi:hypothetical protein
MTRIQVDLSLQQQLDDANLPIELCDSQGRVLGHYVPESHYQKLLYASFKSPLTEEELLRRESETGGRTLAEIWKSLERT